MDLSTEDMGFHHGPQAVARDDQNVRLQLQTHWTVLRLNEDASATSELHQGHCHVSSELQVHFRTGRLVRHCPNVSETKVSAPPTGLRTQNR